MSVPPGRCTPSRALSSSAFLLVNPRSGNGKQAPEDVAAEARRQGIDVHVLGEGDDPEKVARRAAERGADALGAAGGDGSLAPVAAVAVERGLPFVCVPLGTRNHFARDVGLDPDDPNAALRAFGGRERRVDVGLADGRLFLNNVSLGLYAGFVHDPGRKTRNRLMAFVRMAPAALGRSRRALRLSFEAEERREEHEALVVLVANNAYELETIADAGRRETLEEGLLHAYVIEAASRWALLGLLGRAAIGKIEQAKGLEEWSAGEFRLEASRPRVHAAIDGEPAVLESPLVFEIKPRALALLLPAES